MTRPLQEIHTFRPGRNAFCLNILSNSCISEFLTAQEFTTSSTFTILIKCIIFDFIHRESLLKHLCFGSCFYFLPQVLKWEPGWNFLKMGLIYLCGAAVRTDAGSPLSRALNPLYKILWNFWSRDRPITHALHKLRIDTELHPCLESYLDPWAVWNSAWFTAPLWSAW